ncbi:acetyl-CoA carboxylase biotin carboxyl carrier protein subunit [Neobacillus sp. SM06]|uniref:acetyl-CoA carboxylase biotin carboxyl carrier protein subunit n=1 Tax=Neobacillus sp. SM06 TaxID=3422492 RepID=UPI003D2A3302
MSKVVASMAGSVWKILVQPGDLIGEGQEVVILESMKMEIPITAEMSGTVKEVKVNEGDFVNEDDVLIVLDV